MFRSRLRFPLPRRPVRFALLPLAFALPSALRAECGSGPAAEVLTRVTFHSQLRRYELSGFFPYTMASDSDFPAKYRVETWSGKSTGLFSSCTCYWQNINMEHTGAWSFSATNFSDTSTKVATWHRDACGTPLGQQSQSEIRDGLSSEPSFWGPALTSQTETTRIADYSQPDPIPPVYTCDSLWHYWNSLVTETLSEPMSVAEAIARGDNAAPVSTGGDSLQYWNDFSPKTWGAAKLLPRTQPVAFRAQHAAFRVELPAKACGGKYRLILKMKDWAADDPEPAEPTRTLVYPELIELDKKAPTLWPSATTFKTYADFGLPPVQGRKARLVSVELQDAASCTQLPAGHGTFGLGSVDFQLSLGRLDADTPAGILSLTTPVLDAARFTPAALQLSAHPSVTAVREAGILRQVSAPEAVIDIETLSATSYALHAYRPAQAGAPDPATGLRPLTGAPYQSYMFSGNGADELTITPGDVPARAATYTQSAGAMSMSQPGANRVETVTKATAGNTTTETRTITDSAGTLAAQETRVHTTYAFGRVLTSLTRGAGADARTTTTSYYTSSGDTANYGRIQQITEPSGAWVRFTYDTQGRVLTETRRHLNNPGTAGSSHRVTTHTYGTLADQDGDGLAEDLITRVHTTLGIETGRGYALTFSAVETFNGLPTRRSLDIVAVAQGAAWNAAGNLVTTVRTIHSGEHAGKVAATLSPAHILTTTHYSTDPITNRRTATTATGQPDATASAVVAGLRTIVTTDPLGRTLSGSTADIATGTILEARTVTETDAYGRATRIDYDDGTHEARAYACCGLASETDRAGVTTTYLYDVLGRTQYVARQGLGTRYVHDPAGRVRETFRRGSDESEIRLEEAGHDTAGFQVFSRDARDRLTAYQEIPLAGGGLRRVTTMPDGSTIERTSAADGALLREEGGATPWKTCSYAVNPDGSFSTTEYFPAALITETGAWRRDTADFAGRPKSVAYPGGAATLRHYNALGQLAREADADGVQMLFAHDALGERTLAALDMNRDGVVDFGGSDRIQRTTTSYALRGTTPVRRTVTELWETAGSATPTEVSVTETSLDGLKVWRTERGQLTATITILDANTGTRTETTTLPDGTTRVRTRTDGRLSSFVISHSSLGTLSTVTYEHDAHGRLWKVHASTGTTTYAYFDDDQIASVTTPDPGSGAQTTAYAYNTRGWVSKVTAPDGAETHATYWPTGQVKRTWGGRTYPQEYTYDAQGRTKTLTTWQDFAGETGAALTTWHYHPQRGWLASKTYHDNTGPSYTYTAAGRLLTRTWTRGVTTTYSHDNAGDLVGIGYSDTTPGATHTRDRAGRLLATTDAAGTLTRAYAHGILTDEVYTGAGHLAGQSITRTLDSLRRLQSLGIGHWSLDIPTTAYTYDPAGRLSTVAGGFHLASYGYKANVGSVESVAIKRLNVERLKHTRQTDALGRITQVKSASGSTVHVQRDYTYNAANQRVQIAHEDTRQWAYGYDSLGQVTSAQKRLADGTTPLPGYSFGYAFDSIGNRTAATANGRTASYTANPLNQYTSRTVPGALDVTGEAYTDATVTVDALPTTRTAKDFYRERTFANTGAPVSDSVTIEATVAGPPPVTVTEERSVFLPQTPESYTYDLDGNLTADGRWTYVYDAENRLVLVETQPAVATAFPELKRRLEFAYDAQGRRIRKVVKDWNLASGLWVLASDTRFVHDGWNLAAELDALNGNKVLRSYVWGLDLSETMQGAGGVGGLLLANLASETLPVTYSFAPSSDANGNIVAWINTATLAVAGRADYGPFGEAVMQTGVARKLPFGFSSKYTDRETGLNYYGYRYYTPSTGRWLSRDPIAERGGFNLYGMVNNNTVNYWDYLGLVIMLPMKMRVQPDPCKDYTPRELEVARNAYFTADKLRENYESGGTIDAFMEANNLSEIGSGGRITNPDALTGEPQSVADAYYRVEGPIIYFDTAMLVVGTAIELLPGFGAGGDVDLAIGRVNNLIEAVRQERIAEDIYLKGGTPKNTPACICRRLLSGVTILM